MSRELPVDCSVILTHSSYDQFEDHQFLLSVIDGHLRAQRSLEASVNQALIGPCLRRTSAVIKSRAMDKIFVYVRLKEDGTFLGFKGCCSDDIKGFLFQAKYWRCRKCRQWGRRPQKLPPSTIEPFNDLSGSTQLGEVYTSGSWGRYEMGSYCPYPVWAPNVQTGAAADSTRLDSAQSDEVSQHALPDSMQL
jgi:hypothetical protein